MANVSLRQLQAAGQVKPEEAMLPAPDEAREDLLYPVAGFNGQEAESKPKEGVEEHESADDRTAPPPQEGILDALKLELNMIITQYNDFGGTLTKGEEDGLLALETQEDYKQAIQKYKPKRDALQAKDKEKPAEKPAKKIKDDRAGSGAELGVDREGNPIEEKPAKGGRGGPPEGLWPEEESEQ
jgi:hypothetical protein